MSESAPHPTDVDELDDDEIEAWNEQQEQDLREAAEEDYQELSEEQEAALDALADPAEETATVELRDGVDVEVKTYLSGEVEDTLDRIAENRSNMTAVRDDLVDAMAWLIEDEQYGQRSLWTAYATAYGVTSLAPLFMRAVEPALDKLEDDETVQKFREKR